MVDESLKAAETLSKNGIDARVINLHTPKPIDRETVIKAAKETGAIVTAEEHLLNCGMGSAVAEVVSQECPVPMRMVGVDDEFGESGDPEDLLKRFGLNAEAVVGAVEQVLKVK